MSIINKELYKPRIIDNIVDRYLSIAGAICIEGPKWCGKTWTSSFHSNSAYFVGEPNNNFQNRMLAALEPSYVLPGESPRLIDEWQEVPAIWDAIRAEVDKTPKKGQFILTGSSTPLLKGIMHSGAGRILRLRMETMSLYESGDSSGMVSLKDICSGNFNQIINTGNVELSKIAYLIARGGWPGNLDVNEKDTLILPKSYIDSIIQNDIQRLDDNTSYDKGKVKLLIKSLARNESTTAGKSSIVADISTEESKDIGLDTISRYLNTLDRLFLLSNQPPFSPNIRSQLRVKQSEKRHFFDPAISCAILNLTPVKLINDLTTMGFMFEALVERDLRIYAKAFDAELLHYQDYRDNEIDAVIEMNDGSWSAFEIKLGVNQIDKAAENLIKVKNVIERANGKAPKSLCVISGLSAAAYKRTDGVYVVPITALKP